MESHIDRRRGKAPFKGPHCAQRYIGKIAQWQRKEVSGQHKHRLLLPTIPFAEIAEEGEVAATANSTSVRANFFSFPINGFRRGTHFHFVRGQFPSAAEESG